MIQKETCPKCGRECVNIEDLSLEELQELFTHLQS